jgi:NAD(P)-dependent dehydrogenase (short-subunit alcohol dehydrogenase family)
VLVTGASSGFGLGLARAFAKGGWRVIATLRDPQRAPAELSGLPAISMQVARLDLERSEQIHALAQTVSERFDGKLDCLVNNAGFGVVGPFATLSERQIRRQMEVNFFGTVLLTQTLLPALARSPGRVINISSLVGETGMPLSSIYTASKHALEGWSKSIRHELAPRGIQVAVVAPGGFRTRFGDNIEWGELASDEPVGRLQSENLRRIQQRRHAGPGADPQKVVAAVLALAERKRMRPIVRVGVDAKLVHLLHRTLPVSWAEGMLSMAFRRALMKPQR